MKVTNLGSGSKGNCTLVISESGEKFLIDAGLPYAEIKERLMLAGTTADEIKGIFVSHEHIDHVRATYNFYKDFKCKIFVHILAKEAFLEKQKKFTFSNLTFYNETEFEFCGLNILPIPVSHDSAFCCGFRVREDEKSFAIVTDVGEITESIIHDLEGVRLLILEANHNPERLLANPKYPQSVKMRILSKRGHLSNMSCGKTIAKLVSFGNLKQVVLAHLSEENNTPELALLEVGSVLEKHNIKQGEDVMLCLANQNSPTPFFRLM